ncbi:MAG: molecular chaperone HtpG, partial [Eubacteriaceae bacterium]|nr:molecular chaperone HtpG [Eubacteriaceae bacterium]
MITINIVSTLAKRVLTDSKYRKEKQMQKKEFKSESKRLMDLMVHSIYTHKEIFLRELISNASDAIDKVYYKTLTDTDKTFNKEDYYIRIT